MKVYTDPRIFNLTGAVERLPMPANGKARVAKRVANILSEGQSPTGTGEPECSTVEPQIEAGEELIHSSAATGTDRRDDEKSSAGRTRSYSPSFQFR
jgi:hypothetical protein